MQKNKAKPHLIPSIIKQELEPKYLGNVGKVVNEQIADLQDDGTPYVALKYYYRKHQCFSHWEKNDLKGFSAFCEKMQNTNWETIRNSGGTKDKTGLGYTILKNYPVPQSIKDKLSKDTVYFELRASLKRRVIGFKSGSAFQLILLDKNHETT